ncbi:MAG: flavin reductase family protein [Gammaproteobacteria bacterium]
MRHDPAAVLRRLTHGVYVIGVSDGDRCNAFTAAWVMQVSFDPPLLALSIHPQHASREMLVRGGVFTVNVLPEGRMDLAEHFGRPGKAEKLHDTEWHAAKTGAPILDEAMAWLDCEFSHECAAGDHVLVIGRVVDGAVIDADASPMNYRDTGDMDGSSRLFPDEF